MKIIKQTDNEYIFPYITYIPDNISDHPSLIIQLHGAGQRGNGGDQLEEILVHGFANIVNDSNLSDCILIMPQCPENSFWAAKVESIKAFIDKMIETYSANTDKVYLCGLSMGGFGTWYTAMAYPDLFAAILPCCGGGMAWNADTLKMPVWAFHGLDDTIVSPSQTIEMVEALKKTNPNVKCNLLEGIGHNSWNQAFTEETLKWLLSQSK